MKVLWLFPGEGLYTGAVLQIVDPVVARVALQHVVVGYLTAAAWQHLLLRLVSPALPLLFVWA